MYHILVFGLYQCPIDGNKWIIRNLLCSKYLFQRFRECLLNLYRVLMLRHNLHFDIICLFILIHGVTSKKCPYLIESKVAIVEVVAGSS